jgi:predicted transposase YdaD
MQLSGAGLLKLAGFAAEVAERYEFRAVEFKEKQLQRPDVEGIPILETQQTRVTLEFQGYTDKYIRYRSLNNMLQICLKSRDDKSVLGIIVYTEKNYQAAALALDKLIAPLAKATDLIQEIFLTDYSETQLLAADPRLIVLAPFTVSAKLDKTVLKQKVAQWRTQIYAIYPATEELNEALNIIGLLLLNRFRDLSHQEIIDMLNLDLMQSRAGREIYQIGKIEGKQAGLIEGERLIVTRLLERRFGNLPHSLQTRLAQATLAELELWSVELLTATCLADIFKTQ